ncbi:MAG: hypothetical protein RSF33_09190 [Hydrogenoanaerobacterium sp.]
MREKKRFLIPIFIIICYILVLFNIPAILRIDWLTTFFTSIKVKMLEHIEITTLPMVISFMLLLFLKKPSFNDFLFSNVNQSDDLKTSLELNRAELHRSYDDVGGRLELLRSEVKDFAFSSQERQFTISCKVKTTTDNLKNDYKDTFRFTNTMSLSLAKICNHTALASLKEFKQLNKKYCESLEEANRKIW